MITENLSTLKIHKLTQAQYDRELAAGRIDPNALYLTPDEEIDLAPYITFEELENLELITVDDIDAICGDLSLISLSAEQINVLDALFRAASYKEDVRTKYEDFCAMFGIVHPVVHQNEVKKGSSTFNSPSSILVNATKADRALLLPIGRYLTKGKSYKFSLGAASANYYYGVQIISASEAGLKFDYVANSSVNYGGLDSMIENTGWIKEDFEYVVSQENCVLCVGFRNNDTTELTEYDYEILQNNFVLLEGKFEEPNRAFTILLHKTAIKGNNEIAYLLQNSNRNRMTIRASVMNSRRFRVEYSSIPSVYSPVPIPEGAVSAVYSIPNGMKFGMAFLGESESSETDVTYLKDTGWLYASTGVIDVTSYNDGAHYWSANIAYSNDSEISSDFDEETIDVYFVDANGNRLS